MGRHAEGWKLRQRSAGHAYAVRFTHNGTEHERSTGTADRVAATREAARVYAEVVSREPARPRTRRYRDSTPLEDLIGAWLTSAPIDPKTATTFELYAGTHWIPFFESLRNINDALCSEYMRARLKVVKAETVRKELSALRGFLRWARERGTLERDVLVPSVPKRAQGTPFEKRRRGAAIELAPREIAGILRRLPEWSTSRRVDRFPIRARFVVQYETGLRPDTINMLSVPEHWDRKSKILRVAFEVDKQGWEREVPLTETARKALLRVAPKAGLIFGAHDYREHLKEAAAAVLGAERAKRFTGAHLRSARITHLLETSGNIPGVQHLVGHKRTATTARYVRPSFRAAADALAGRR